MDISTIESEALDLPARERARLARRLLESLDELSEAEMEKLWIEEASRRARELDEGDVDVVSGDELEERVRARLT